VSAIKVIDEKCIGCGACVKVCPYGAITMKEKLAVIDITKCTLCGACVEVCPVDAIEITVKRTAVEGMEDYNGVWVFAEQREGKIQSVVYELIGAGQRLAKVRKSSLSAVLFGKEISDDVLLDLFQRGADRVFIADDETLEQFNDEVYSKLLVKLIKEYKPEIVLAGATALGRSLIPRVAVELKTGLTADCTGLEIDEQTGHLLQTRPAFGGNIMATILCEHTRPQMATVRHKVMPEAEPDKSRGMGEVVKVSVDDTDKRTRTKVLEVIKELEDTVNIAEADVIVSGGRGLKSPENFEMLKDLAKVLNGAVGASRAAVDAGWISYSHQVGQTGKTVKPKVYIAVGISGAIQHLVGMSSSDVIIAVNKNPDAPIFEVADYGLVGDLFEIVPELTKRFKEIL